MTTPNTTPKPPSLQSRSREGEKIFFEFWKSIFLLLGLYLFLAYGLIPFFWRHYEHNPSLESSPKRTSTAEGIPGDPLNVGLVGTESELIEALLKAGWSPADPITFRSAERIVLSILEKRNYPTAPVSNLYLFGRKEDLAFERQVGGSPKERHHVRFWLSPEKSPEGRPFWIGAATFDKTYGISHRTGQVTHHIAADIDEERDTVIRDLTQAHQLTEIYQVTGIGPTLWGRNGGGDRYFTDGELTVGVLSPGNAIQTQGPKELPNPFGIEMKNKEWDLFRSLLKN